MINFEYYNPIKIIFGKGSETQIKTELENYNVKSILLIYSGDFIKTLGIFGIIENICKELEISFIENGNVAHNPQIELVRDLTNEAKKAKVDFIIAVGESSTINTAKAVAMGMYYNGDIWDFFEGKAQLNKAISVGVITTLLSGELETFNATSISNGFLQKEFKDNKIIPKFVIMNPDFTSRLPAYQTACGIADIFAHLVEGYFTTVEQVDTTDYLIEGACKSLIRNGLKLMENPSDYNARAEIQWLSFIAHNNILNTGRMGDCTATMIVNELIAQYGLTQGEGMAIVLIGWVKYIAIRQPDKLIQLANRVFNIDIFNNTEQEIGMQLSEEFKNFFTKLQLSVTLKELGIYTSHFEEMATRATINNTQKVGHYNPLDKDGFIEVLNLCL
ncbi:alcohol dehydrogenase [Candidatus Epulonipiscioides gigas]|nr:alcohol dehydrogenase [Epulopiscium sp. SCG-C07WGA-EpuloA2]